ncbi:MAG: hypothetical protein ABID45_00145 [Patescibacteria group bacterium]
MRKFFVVCCLLLLWILIPTFFVLISLQFSFFSPDFYKDQLEEQDSYNRFVELAVDNFVLDDFVEIDKNIDENGGEEIIESGIEDIVGAFSAAWLQSQVEATIDNIFSLFKSDQKLEEANLEIDISEPMEKVPFFGEAFSDKINLLDYTQGENLNQIQDTLLIIQTVIQWTSYVLIGSIVLAGLLILGIILLVKKNLVTICKWLGSIFFLPGLVGVGSILIQKYFLGIYTPDFGQLGYFSDLLTDLIQEVVGSFLNILLWPFSISAIFGLLMIIIAYVVSKIKK